jgi:hypothetical protein
MNGQHPNPVPKAQRAPRVEKAATARTERKAKNKRRSNTKHATSYARRDGEPSWPEVKKRILARDGCCLWSLVMLGKRVPAEVVHHCRSVASGGRNTGENLIALSHAIHALAHDGHISRRQFQAVLSERYGYS